MSNKIALTLFLIILVQFNIVYSQDSFSLTNIHVIGNEESKQDEYIFRGPTFAVQDSKLNLYVVDQRSTEIKIFDNSGRFLKKLGRNGRGPGEFLNISSIDIINSDTLVVFDRVNQRFTKLDINGVIESYSPKHSDLGFINVRKVISHKEGYLILMYSEGFLQGGNSNSLFVFDNEFNFQEESYGSVSNIWNTNNRFSNYLAYLKQAFSTSIRKERIYVAPELHENHITEINLEKKTEKKIYNNNELEFSSFVLHDVDNFDKSIPNKMLFSGIYGKFVVEAINRTLGVFDTDGQVSKFSIQKLNENESALIVDIYSNEGVHVRSLNLKTYDGHPINTLKVLDFKSDRLILSNNSSTPKIEVYELKS